jgi:cell division protein FtsN
MREMDKWKDKVELSLDNRQIFFLFFGLSVVGCFVFALGVMVGRRVDFGPEGQVAALAGDSLAMFEDDAQEHGELSFKQGLSEPAHVGLPETRDPDDLEKEPADPTPQPEKAKAEPAAKPAAPEKAKAAPKTPKASDTVLSAGTSGPKTSAAAPAPRKAETADAAQQFTLQMKAFAKKEEAEAFAAPLRSNGHPVRVEEHEIKGRVWHRVRVGQFENWQDGLAAKDAFEAQEKIIAYVVRL